MPLLFALQLLSTFAMFGLIWFVQIVHYPLHARVGPDEFLLYETEHANRTGYVAAPLMTLELLTAAALLLPRWRPAFVSPAQAWWGAAMVGILWLSTGLIQVPLHNRLHRKHSVEAIQQLIFTNWLRTLLWTARTVLLLLWLVKAPLSS